eukprot:s1595_g2.t1
MSCWLAGCEGEPQLLSCGRHHFQVFLCDHHRGIGCPRCGAPLAERDEPPCQQQLRAASRELLHTTKLVPSADYLRLLYPMQDTAQLLRLLQDRNVALSERQRDALNAVARRRHSADSLELDEFLACEELQKLLQEAGQHKSLKIWQGLEEGERQELLHLQ